MPMLRYQIYFVLFFVVRVLFWQLTHSLFSMKYDADRYMKMSDEILAGNYNLDIGAFLVSPLYPFWLAGVKWCFGADWNTAAVLLQIAGECFAGIFLLKMADDLFGEHRLRERWLATGYAFYIFILVFSQNIGQESPL
jgi:hypothetical protein